MINWLKRLIAGRELDELERLRNEPPEPAIDRLSERAGIVEECAEFVEAWAGLWSNLRPDDSRRLARFISRGMREHLKLARCSPARPADFWDLAQEPEGRVRYEHLGMTGLEEE